MNKTKEKIDILDIYLNNFEIEVKGIGTNRERMSKDQVEKYYNLQQRFITECKCDKVAKKAI